MVCCCLVLFGTLCVPWKARRRRSRECRAVRTQTGSPPRRGKHRNLPERDKRRKSANKDTHETFKMKNKYNETYDTGKIEFKAASNESGISNVVGFSRFVMPPKRKNIETETKANADRTSQRASENARTGRPARKLDQTRRLKTVRKMHVVRHPRLGIVRARRHQRRDAHGQILFAQRARKIDTGRGPKYQMGQSLDEEKYAQF